MLTVNIYYTGKNGAAKKIRRRDGYKWNCGKN